MTTFFLSSLVRFNVCTLTIVSILFLLGCKRADQNKWDDPQLRSFLSEVVGLYAEAKSEKSKGVLDFQEELEKNLTDENRKFLLDNIRFITVSNDLTEPVILRYENELTVVCILEDGSVIVKRGGGRRK